MLLAPLGDANRNQETRLGIYLSREFASVFFFLSEGLRAIHRTDGGNSEGGRLLFICIRIAKYWLVAKLRTKK